MPTLDLNKGKMTIGTTNDNIAIVQCLECSPTGGRVLDVTGYSLPMIEAGHIIIKATSGEGAYKPMPINSDGKTYASLPSDHKIAGVLYSSINTSQPSASIMVRGSVNKVASPFAITEEIEKALPLINFTKD